MHPSFVSVLCCPETRESLWIEPRETGSNGMVVSGTLASLSGQRYPIVDGIPRFVDVEQYAASFGYEWNRWPRVQFESENVGTRMTGHTTRMWEAITALTEKQLDGKTIVEFGCGPGRFLDVVRRRGGRAVGIDLSLAVEAAGDNFAYDPNVLIVQGDILIPPFREQVFDGGFTIGVLHHTPNPLAGLKAMTPTIRSGGWVACSVYPKTGFYNYPSVARFRWLHNRLKSVLGYRPALLYSYLSSYVIAPLIAKGRQVRCLDRVLRYLERNWLVSLDYLPDVRWRLLDTFDAITPPIASTHNGEEVKGWMKDAGCTNVRSTSWGDTAVTGIRV